MSRLSRFVSFGSRAAPLLIAVASCCGPLAGQAHPPAAAASLDIRDQVRKIAADAQGEVSVACLLPRTSLNCDLNPHTQPPMQSVFKLPLAMAILDRVEKSAAAKAKGSPLPDALTLDDPIHFLPSDRFIPHEYSPLQDRYPEANVDVGLRELLALTVTESDNAAADILLRLLGGPAVLDQYIASLGIVGFHAEHSEHQLQQDVKAQFNDWFEPAAAVALLDRIAHRSPLSLQHTALLLGWMSSGRTLRIKRYLPANTPVAHKSGTSGVRNGLAFATNDIGLITLPDGRRIAIAIFVTNSTADEATREDVIGRIALAAYQAATRIP